MALFAGAHVGKDSVNVQLGDGVFALEESAIGRSLKMLGPGIRCDSDAGPFPFFRAKTHWDSAGAIYSSIFQKSQNVGTM